jgi:hypothetical protein
MPSNEITVAELLAELERRACHEMERLRAEHSRPFKEWSTTIIDDASANLERAKRTIGIVQSTLAAMEARNAE